MNKEYGDMTKEVLEQVENGGAFLMTGSPVNPMTIGWFQIGRVWNRPVATVLVRVSRHSFAAMKNEGRFTVSVPAKGTMAKELAFCGTHSGRDTNKMAALGLETTPSRAGGVPGLKGCAIQIECKVLYATETMDLAKLDPSPMKFYDPKEQAGDDGDPHVIFLAEVLDMYRGQ